MPVIPSTFTSFSVNSVRNLKISQSLRSFEMTTFFDVYYEYFICDLSSLRLNLINEEI